MAQAMINLHKKFSTISTQTYDDDDEFCVYLDRNKTFRVYKSKSYKSYVLSFNFGNFKKYIISKPMWSIFRKNIPRIDRILIDYKSK